MKAAVAIVGLMLAGVQMRAQNAAPASEGTTGDEALKRAGNLPPRATPGDYQFRVQAGKITVAAEFSGHSILTTEGGPYTTEDFVMVEAALFGPAGTRLPITYQDFSLRVNGKKMPLPAVPYLAVFKSLKDPDWEPTSAQAKENKTVVGGGADGKDGDLPRIEHMPIERQRAMQQRVTKVSLGEGERPLPQAGFLFFEYRNGDKTIHSMELIYNGPAGKATLALQK
jgi:hypothetical protein